MEFRKENVRDSEDGHSKWNQHGKCMCELSRRFSRLANWKILQNSGKDKIFLCLKYLYKTPTGKSYMSSYCHQVWNTNSQDCLLYILVTFPTCFDNNVAKAVLPSCETFALMHYLTDVHYFTEQKKIYLEGTVTSPEVKIETMRINNGSWVNWLWWSRHVENFVIKAPTHLVNTREQELFWTERMPQFSYKNNCKLRAKLSQLLNFSYHLSFLFF